MNASRLRRRLRSAVRRPARKLLTPGPPTAELLHPIGPEVPDDRHVQQVIDLCIRIGEVLLSSGEGSGETTETMLRVANAFGLSAVDVDITFTAVTICCHRGMAATPITSMRLVTHRGLDLTLLARVYRLVEQIERRPAPRGWWERLHCCWAHRPSRCSRPPASPRSSTSPGGSWPGSGCLRSSGR